MLAALLALAPYPDDTDAATNIRKLVVQRGMMVRLGGFFHPAEMGSAEAVAALGPVLSECDRLDRQQGLVFSGMALWPEISSFRAGAVMTLRCRAAFSNGRHDLVSSQRQFGPWYERLTAPDKHRIGFPDPAHVSYAEEPARFLAELVNVSSFAS